MMNFLRKLFARNAPPVRAPREAAAPKPAPQFDQTPDGPNDFGYKVSWFAVRTSDPGSVLDALGLGEATPSNWLSGLDAVFRRSMNEDPWVFISPPVDGWVFAVSGSWPYPAGESHRDFAARFDMLFTRLMKRFDDVQFFGSHRVSDFACWARAVDGEPVRIFAYGDGEVMQNFGNQTAEEAKLRLVDLSGLSPRDACDEIFRVVEEQGQEEEKLVAAGLSHADAVAKVRETGVQGFPDEESVVDLAALWSLHPLELSEQDHPPGVGWVIRLPNDLGQ
jgi:hypothetical protein